MILYHTINSDYNSDYIDFIFDNEGIDRFNNVARMTPKLQIVFELNDYFIAVFLNKIEDMILYTIKNIGEYDHIDIIKSNLNDNYYYYKIYFNIKNNNFKLKLL